MADDSKKFVVAQVGPQLFQVLDTREVDEHGRYMVNGEYRSAKLARGVARDREDAAAEAGQ